MRRVMLHRRVLQCLVDAPEVDPGRLVHHARAAGDGTRGGCSGAVLTFTTALGGHVAI